MMVMEDYELSRQLVYAGPLPPDVVIAAGIALGLLMCFLLWRECGQKRRRLFPALAALRLGALAVVLWMATAPVVETTSRGSRPRSLAVLLDTSASMGVVDSGEDAAVSFRWSAAGHRSGSSRVLRLLDGAAVLLETARHSLGQLAAESRTGTSSTIDTTLSSAWERIERGCGHLEKVSADISAIRADLGAGVWGVRTRVAGNVMPEVATLVEDLRQKRLMLTESHLERLSIASRSLAGEAEELRRLADELARELAARVDADQAPGGGDASAGSRLDKAIAMLDRAEKDWDAEPHNAVEVIRYGFAAEVAPIAGDDWEAVSQSDRFAGGFSTDLSSALRQIALDQTGKPVEAALLVTDGGHNADRALLESDSALADVPVYVVPVGNPQPARDVIVHHVQAPRAVLKGDLITVEAMVDAYGCAGERLVLELWDGRTPVDSTELSVPIDAFAERIEFTRKAERLGVQSFRIRALEVADERGKENNSGEVDVAVIEAKLRVFLVDDLPRWEYRYLRNLFRRDERVDFDEFLIEPRSTTGAPARGAGFPGDLDGWSRYRVVVLGDVRPTQLTVKQQELLEQYVGERGGTLILIGGDHSMPEAYLRQPLGQLIPVQPTGGPAPNNPLGFALSLTAEGRALPMTQLEEEAGASDRLWYGLPPLYLLPRYSIPKPTAHVLIGMFPRGGRDYVRASKHAFLCWHYYGKGRVVYLTAPITYRLRFRCGDRYHHRFWGELLRWAIARELAGGSRTVSVATDRVRYLEGDAVHVSVRLRNLNGTAVRGAICRVLARRGEEILAEIELAEAPENPGTYSGALVGLPAGTVLFEATSPEIEELLFREAYKPPVTANAIIDAPEALELQDTRCNLALLSRIAESTGGLVVPPTAVPDIVAGLGLSDETVEKTVQRPIWNRWSWLWVLLACLAGEWSLRKAAGLA